VEAHRRRIGQSGADRKRSGNKARRRHPLASPDEAGGVRSGFVSENVIGSELIKDLRLRLVEHR
jgi:hypothetical protein